MDKVERIKWVDYLRFLACFFVIMVHVPEIGQGIYEKSYTYISRIAVPIFFMMSGYLTLPYNKSITTLFSKRLSRLFFPFLFWSILYAILPYFFGDKSFLESMKTILFLPLRLSSSHLWYMYSIIGLTLISPIISPWLRIASQKQIAYFLLIWLITLFFPYIKLIDSGIEMNEWNSIYTLYYFSGYLGYYLLGFYIRKVKLEVHNLKYFAFFIGLIILNFVFVFVFLRYTNAALEVTRYLTVNVTLFSIGVFMIVKKMSFRKGKLYSIVLEISKKSFGIYLAHELVLRRLILPIFEEMPFYNILSRPAITVSTLIVTYLMILGVSKLPNSKYLIG